MSVADVLSDTVASLRHYASERRLFPMSDSVRSRVDKLIAEMDELRVELDSAPLTRLTERASAVEPSSKAALYVRDKLGVNLDGLDAGLIVFPVVEGESEDRVYVKFMSENGVLDDELGDRFAASCQLRGVIFTRRRPRSGFVNLRAFPGAWDANEVEDTHPGKRRS